MNRVPEGLDPAIQKRELVFTRMTMHVTASFRVTGSVLSDTVEGEMLGAETRLELDSPDPPERVARVVRNAERGCFVRQALLRPVAVTTQTVLNGEALSTER